MSLGCNLYEPFAYNGMRLEAVYYFGFEALSCRKNIAIKLEKFFTEIYIAIFFLAGIIHERRR